MLARGAAILRSRRGDGFANFSTALPDRKRQTFDWGFAPVFINPRTLVRTWGTRPELVECKSGLPGHFFELVKGKSGLPGHFFELVKGKSGFTKTLLFELVKGKSGLTGHFLSSWLSARVDYQDTSFRVGAGKEWINGTLFITSPGIPS